MGEFGSHRDSARNLGSLRCGVSAIAICAFVAAGPALAQDAAQVPPGQATSAEGAQFAQNQAEFDFQFNRCDAGDLGAYRRHDRHHGHPAEPSQLPRDQAQLRHSRRCDHGAGYRRSSRPIGYRSAAARSGRRDQSLFGHQRPRPLLGGRIRRHHPWPYLRRARSSTGAIPSRPAFMVRESTSRTCRPSCSARSRFTRIRRRTGSKAASPAPST